MPQLPDVNYTLEYPYTRTTGPVIGPFLTGLCDGRILGQRCGDRVLCPPMEFNPDTFETLDPDLVEVGPGGEVVNWTWVAEPSAKHPFDHPFGFAFIKLDGADTAIVHAVDASSADAMSIGMRVRAQFRGERHGSITDVYFVPEGNAVDQSIEPGAEPVTITEHLIGLRISEPLYPHRARFAQGLLDGKIIGQRSPVTGKVYVPGRGYDNMSRVLMTEADEVVVSDVGTVVAFTELNPVQYYGQTETEPYVRCSVLFDGADQPVVGIDIRDRSVDEMRIGMRVRCVWRPPEERSVEEVDNRYGNIPETVYERFEPTGEPDVPAEELKEYSW